MKVGAVESFISPEMKRRNTSPPAPREAGLQN